VGINRERRHMSTPSKGWCSFCDAQKVNKECKCKNCGKRDETKQLKKFPPPDYIKTKEVSPCQTARKGT
jgi:hypothetical protein